MAGNNSELNENGGNNFYDRKKEILTQNFWQKKVWNQEFSQPSLHLCSKFHGCGNEFGEQGNHVRGQLQHRNVKGRQEAQQHLMWNITIHGIDLQLEQGQLLIVINDGTQHLEYDVSSWGVLVIGLLSELSEHNVDDYGYVVVHPSGAIVQHAHVKQQHLPSHSWGDNTGGK